MNDAPKAPPELRALSPMYSEVATQPSTFDANYSTRAAADIRVSGTELTDEGQPSTEQGLGQNTRTLEGSDKDHASRVNTAEVPSQQQVASERSGNLAVGVDTEVVDLESGDVVAKPAMTAGRAEGAHAVIQTTDSPYISDEQAHPDVSEVNEMKVDDRAIIAQELQLGRDATNAAHTAEGDYNDQGNSGDGIAAREDVLANHVMSGNADHNNDDQASKHDDHAEDMDQSGKLATDNTGAGQPPFGLAETSLGPEPSPEQAIFNTKTHENVGLEQFGAERVQMSFGTLAQEIDNGVIEVSSIVIDGEKTDILPDAAQAVGDAIKLSRILEAEARGIDCGIFSVLVCRGVSRTTVAPRPLSEAREVVNYRHLASFEPVDTVSESSLPPMQLLWLGTADNVTRHIMVKLPTEPDREGLYISKLGSIPPDEAGTLASGSAGAIIISNLQDIAHFYGATHVGAVNSIRRVSNSTGDVVMDYTTQEHDGSS